MLRSCKSATSLEVRRANQVRLMSFNPNYPPLEFERSDFRFIYPVAVQVRYYNRMS